jgi:hypothetical protein
MAFLRFNRDTRGYEYFCLVQQTTNRRGKVRPRLLYWFRTPPNVKVGRQPFDDAVRRALEAQNPDIHFDWQAILDTPIPPPVEPERWRERRRFERAARQAAAEETADAEASRIAAGESHDAHAGSGGGSSQTFDVTTLNCETVENAIDHPDVQLTPSPLGGLAAPQKPDSSEAPLQPQAGAAHAGLLDIVRRKRRRRGRRGRSTAISRPDGSTAADSVVLPRIELTEPSDPEEGE